MEKINIEITEDFDIYVATKSSSGVSEKKMISLNDLSNILNLCTSKITQRVSTVKVKKNILYMSPLMPNLNGVHVLQHIIKEDGYEIVVLQREARRSRVAFYDDVFDDVGMPSLIFAITIINGVLQTARVMAVKDKIINPDTILYNFPLPNVYSGGGICFGGNNIREYSVDGLTLNNIHSFPNMFLMMPTSMEITSNNGYDMEVRPLLNHLKGKDFDNKKLKKSNYTYKSWIDLVVYQER